MSASLCNRTSGEPIQVQPVNEHRQKQTASERSQEATASEVTREQIASQATQEQTASVPPGTLLVKQIRNRSRVNDVDVVQQATGEPAATGC